MAHSTRKWSGVSLGRLAFTCVLVFPLTILFAIVTGCVIQAPLAWIGLCSFAASLPLGFAAWRLGARDLSRCSAAGGVEVASREALHARSLGRATIVLWMFLVAFAALTYTRPV